MNKYKVKISHVFSQVLDIEAASEEEAREKARGVLETGESNILPQPQYENTLPSEHWPVITEEKYNEMVENLQKKIKQETSNIITP
jgi:hypothetical protein